MMLDRIYANCQSIFKMDGTYTKANTTLDQ